MTIVLVLLPLAKMLPLSYLVPNQMSLNIGDFVLVPFRSKIITGIVFKISNELVNDSIKLKEVKQHILSGYRVDETLIELIQRASRYYLASYGDFTKLVMPIEISEITKKDYVHEQMPHYILPALSSAQNQAYQSIQNHNGVSLLKGVTGSGKTEVYFHLIDECLKAGKQALLILPEIALGHQIIKRCALRFNSEPAVWNSSITLARKKKYLHGIITGKIRLIAGARSSLFLPYKNLGLVIIDEEHDSSYKQEESLIYNARDMAVLKSTIAKIKLVLCSATPSIETIYNVKIGKYHGVELKHRHRQASMPDIKIIDLKTNKLKFDQYLSKIVIQQIQININKKEQTLLFLNRRGYAPLLLCSACGYRFNCFKCSASLVMHKHSKKLECHHCGYYSKIHTRCPECKKDDSLVACGPGIEKIEEEVRKLFPTINVAVLSRDSKNSELIEAISKIEQDKVDLIIGTQIITKGYHFPNLTLICVVDADLGLIGGDLRASERTFQLLHQVGGRAGREHKKGLVLLQSYYPDNKVLKALTCDEEEAFIEQELENRKQNLMPPFTKIASLTITDKNEQKALETIKKIIVLAPPSEAKIFGPAKALISKVAGKYRYKLLVIVERHFHLQKYLEQWLKDVKIPSTVRLKIDIDPQTLL